MSGNVRTALTEEPAIVSFVVLAKFCGMFLVVLDGGCCEDRVFARR